MATKIDTVTARDNLKARHAPYWQKIRSECHLGYRKTTPASFGTWIARYRDGDGKYQLKSLGSLDTLPGHRRYDEAVKLATQWFEHRSSGGSATSITVGEACKRYVERKRTEGKEGCAKDATSRFNRWMYRDEKLSKTLVTRLTPGTVNDWRAKLTKAPVLLQDKTKLGTRQKVASSINREMAALRAALNLAFEDGYATSDSAWKKKLKAIENADNRRDCYLDIEQRRALIAASPADLGAFIRALSMLPLRPGAVAAMTVGQFDKRLGVITIGKDKKGGDRKITLPTSIARFFESQTTDKLPTARLFMQANGKVWNKDTWKKPFKVAAKTAKLPTSAVTYNLRHAAITDLIVLHHLDTMTVAQLAGTSLAMIEKHYGHLLRGHAASALAKLAL